jgi:hypothetical protein
MIHLKNNTQAGFILPTLLSILIALCIIIVSVADVIDLNYTNINRNNVSQKAFNVSEAGINYYLWHLSHNNTDYKDGKTTPSTPDATLGYGPYVHNYIDNNAATTGTYTLWIKPQGNGSTVVTVRSIGKITGSNVTRTIEAQVGAPSFASYAVASDSALWFGSTETSNGPVHSNQGIRMDGASNADITSANSTYIPSTTIGGNGSTSHPGVWCSSTITTPVNCNTRSKVDWRYPVPSIDFNQVSGSLCTMKKLAFLANAATSSLAALANACTQTPTNVTSAYLPQRATNGSYTATKGYLISLNGNNTYDLYKVDGETDTATTTYTGALTRTLVSTAVTLPSSGIIFAEDNVWVRSNGNFTGRLTIAAGRLATTSNANITIADNLTYSNKNGSDALGLIAEGNVTLAPYAPANSGNFTLEVDAAIIAQSGSVFYPSNFVSGTGTCTKGWVGSSQLFKFYGSIATRQTWTWTWDWGNSSCGSNIKNPATGAYVSGVLNNTTQYDYNLLYAPPPSFPITSSYNILSWREVLVTP